MMPSPVFFLPLVGLVAFSGYMGLRLGQVPTDTEIINQYAERYLATAPTGAEVTDCAAVPHPSDAIRMIVHCVHESGVAATFFIGPRGRELPPDVAGAPGA